MLKKLFNIYLRLVKFGINNIVSGLNAGERGVGNLFIGSFALIAAAAPFMLLGALPQILPIVLPIAVLALIVGLSWKILSDRQKGIDSQSSILSFFSFNRLKSFFSSSSSGSNTIADMWKEEPFRYSSADGIHALLGWTTDKHEVWFELNDDPPHAVLAGTTGSGKSNFLHVLIHGLLHRFSPDELNLYLFDYKDGVEFTIYAEEKIPHIQFVATVNDSEYGITALKWFQEEITRRNNEFRHNGVRDISSVRKNNKPMPRMLIVIDEFQYLLNDARVTEEAYTLLSDIFRRGRSAGIHVLLATQSLSGLRGSITGGFDTLKTQLGYRIALKCNQSDSRTIFTDDNIEAAALEAKKEAICNKQNGVKEANIKFNVPYAEPVTCRKHLQDIAAKLKQHGYTADTKVFDGANLPTVPAPTLFSQFKGKILLGEQLSFEAVPFAFQWERFQGNNLCAAGIDNKIRKGIVRSVLFSCQQGNLFDRVIYYHSDTNRPTMNFREFPNIEVKDSTWNCDITTLVSNISAKRTLFIIDSLDNARIFYPKRKYGPAAAPQQTVLKEFLDKAPQHGSFVLAFVDNWGRFSQSDNDYLENFELYIGFCLKDDDAGCLITGNMGRPFGGLTQPLKAIFVDRQRNTQTLFRPFVAAD